MSLLPSVCGTLRSRQLADQLKLVSEDFVKFWCLNILFKDALTSMLEDRKIFKSASTRKWPQLQLDLEWQCLHFEFQRPSGGLGSRGLSRESFTSTLE